jgi:hypothetical protein
LRDLEQNGSDFELKRRRKQKPLPGLDDPNPVVDALNSLKVDELSPMEAMMKLYEFQRMARDG